MAAPLVSVVMPVHDAATTIGASIASVRSQTFDDWELILVDDASTDDSVSVARAACAGMAQALTVCATGSADTGSSGARGPALARNLGLDEARGTLVAFLDADDLWEPTYLSARAEAFSSHPDVGLVWGPARYWHPDQPDRDRVEGTELAAASQRFEPGDVIQIWLHSLMRAPGMPATVVRADVARAAGGFPAELRRGEDVGMCMRVSADAPVLWDERVFFRYRRHPESSTARSARQASRARLDLEFARWVVRFVHDRRRLECRAVAARNLHGAAQLAAVELPPLRAQWATTRAMLAEPGARPFLWWLAADWLLPRPLARRAAAVCHEWSGANSAQRFVVLDRHRGVDADSGDRVE